MGKGIALRFKRIYPEMFRAYRDHCERGVFDIGQLFLYKTSHKWILNFPTKEHWRYPSRIEYIEAGLRKFVASYADMRITSIAFPALGCGNGELDFDGEVKPVMEDYLGNISLPTFVYPGLPNTEPPEHSEIDRINEWLRSDPTVLPFDEVWRDIRQILRARDTFVTLVRESMYRVEVTKEAVGLEVTSGNRKYRIDEDELVQFWQQLRDYGFTHRNIVPKHYRISYLIPVFERLPYVRRVDLSASVSGLRTMPRAGLQIVPHRAKTKWATRRLFSIPVNAS